MKNLTVVLAIFFASFCTHTYLTIIASEPKDGLEESFIDTNGFCIASWDPSGIRISGWVMPFNNNAEVNAFYVQIREKEFYVPAVIFDSVFNFVISIDPKDRLDFKNNLIKVTPLVQTKRGQPFYYLFDSYLPLPPEDEIDLIGRGDLVTSASHLMNILSRCGLKKTDTVLEVGCGLGRVGYALAYYLEPTARYEGFDIVPALINRANSCVADYYRNFHFQYVDIYNGMYNPNGTILSTDFVFPYPDESFDFVFLTSVFTHMFPEDVKHYLQEIKRVLRPGGKCMATALLLNQRSRAFIDDGVSKVQFKYEHGECFTHDANLLEGAIAYDEDLILQWIDSAKYQSVQVFPGCWCNYAEEKKCVTFQDLLLFTK